MLIDVFGKTKKTQINTKISFSNLLGNSGICIFFNKIKEGFYVIKLNIVYFSKKEFKLFIQYPHSKRLLHYETLNNLINKETYIHVLGPIKLFIQSITSSNKKLILKQVLLKKNINLDKKKILYITPNSVFYKKEKLPKIKPKKRSKSFNSTIKNKFIIFVPYCDYFKDFILECLNSIYIQNYNYYEVIIINDGSDDVENIDLFIKDKPNFIKIDYEENFGPAYSKWKFIEFIKKNIQKYSFNDICLIIDGDDYILKNALNIINLKYLNTKCWATFGECKSDCKFTKSHNKYAIADKNYENIRNRQFFANHPRTFKLGLLENIQIDVFKYENEWLSKGTDFTLLSDIFEIIGNNHIRHINEQIYFYRIHPNNTFNFKDDNDHLFKKKCIEFIKNRKKKKKAKEIIHIVMCCWKRYQNIEKQFDMLVNQTIKNHVHWHLVNNNYDERDELEKIVKNLQEKSSKKLSITLSHYKNKYFGYQRFLYIRDYIMKKYIIDYVVIIDDDQIFDKNWIKNIWSLRRPKIYAGWYCKKWKYQLNYWKGSIIDIKDCLANVKRDVIHIDYVGTGGSLIDVSIFQKNSIFWDVPNNLPLNVSIFNIEDLYLSFISKYKFNYKLKRTFFPEKISTNNISKVSHDVSLYKNLKNEKQLLLNYLFRKYKIYK